MKDPRPAGPQVTNEVEMALRDSEERLSRNYSELKMATVWMCLVDGNFHIKTREPHGSPNSGRGIY
jgi:hypothetical protein